MLYEDYKDKWIFRSGDLHAEQIKDNPDITLGMACWALDDLGLIFDTKEDAERARTVALTAIKLSAEDVESP